MSQEFALGKGSCELLSSSNCQLGQHVRSNEDERNFGLVNVMEMGVAIEVPAESNGLWIALLATIRACVALDVITGNLELRSTAVIEQCASPLGIAIAVPFQLTVCRLSFPSLI